jgi:predicted nucleic acid-binding protein
VLSEFIAAKLSRRSFAFIQSLLQKEIGVSVITEIELRSWKAGSKIESIIGQMVKEMSVIQINEDIKELAIQIRRDNNVKLPDALIAATAISQGATLITLNTKDFKPVMGLTIKHPES